MKFSFIHLFSKQLHSWILNEFKENQSTHSQSVGTLWIPSRITTPPDKEVVGGGDMRDIPHRSERECVGHRKLYIAFNQDLQNDKHVVTSFKICAVLILSSLLIERARGSVLGWGTMLQAGRSPVRVLDEMDFFGLPNPSSRTVILGSTQLLTEVSTRNLPGGKKRPALKAENLAAISEPNVWKMWESKPLNTLRTTQSVKK
jgi:hypothetical protein